MNITAAVKMSLPHQPFYFSSYCKEIGKIEAWHGREMTKVIISVQEISERLICYKVMKLETHSIVTGMSRYVWSMLMDFRL